LHDDRSRGEKHVGKHDNAGGARDKSGVSAQMRHQHEECDAGSRT
jgi:hypothetical protein